MLVALATLSACDASEPSPDEPSFAVRLTIPGVTNRTFFGDSLYWRVFARAVPIGAPPSYQLTLNILVLDPPEPLEPPLVLEARWRSLEEPLPAPGTYPLGFSTVDEIILEAESNIGTWAASEGRLTLTDVTDTSLAGSFEGALVPVFPPESGLPELTAAGAFRAPRAADPGSGSGP